MQLKSERVLRGFRINWINLMDTDMEVVLWHSSRNYLMPDMHYEAVLPGRTLDRRAVTCTIDFTSSQRINNLKLKHKKIFLGYCLREWNYEVGTVLANMEETWTSTFEHEEGTSSSLADILSGKLYMETSFYDGNILLGTTKVLMIYI